MYVTVYYRLCLWSTSTPIGWHLQAIVRYYNISPFLSHRTTRITHNTYLTLRTLLVDWWGWLKTDDETDEDNKNRLWIHGWPNNEPEWVGSREGRITIMWMQTLILSFDWAQLNTKQTQWVNDCKPSAHNYEPYIKYIQGQTQNELYSTKNNRDDVCSLRF